MHNTRAVLSWEISVARMADKKILNRHRYQLHLWLGEKEYRLLQELSREEDEPMSRILRRMIRQLVTNSATSRAGGNANLRS